jgi:hypothetical protein
MSFQHRVLSQRYVSVVHLRDGPKRGAAPNYQLPGRSSLASFDLIELSAGVAFVDCLPAAEARERLGATIARLHQNVTRLGAIASGVPQGAGPPRSSDLLELWRANLAATADSLGHIDIVGPHD